MENLAVEWKSCWKNEYPKVICTFANSKDGDILKIGADNNRNAVGVTDPKEVL